ncbi:thioredoxin-disulfide reductase [Candidatus Falkowbacteria bacterium]|jgi:thioredoxin-disulfide reductase|nr:thioredoxin-disulfide reductase [Candidatus Falkowbacteria bacterium]
MYDLIIIGSGPAGMTAGIYAARREMKTLIIGKEVGGQMVWANEIENYPGFEKINAFELIERFRQQTLSFGVEMKNDEVKQIEKMADGNFLLQTNKESFQAKTVIIAMGLSPRRLAVKGEVEFNGRGVSYCANCDGPFFKNKKVAVVGAGNSALDAAEVLSKIASQVYLIHRNDRFRAFDSLITEVKSRENIEIILDTNIESIEGGDKVEKIIISNANTKEKREIELDGVFIEIGRIASTDLVKDLVERNEKSQIIVNSKTETKTPGLFAAGDVTDCEFKQISIASGQATIAALSAYQYLQLKSGKEFIVKNY